MKKVIHVGGSSYSGSTLLDMTLANDPRGFSCGEVHAIFHPFRKHHLEMQCGCGDSACSVWARVREAGANNLYPEIFRRFPQIDFIVDSSKPPVWIMDQTRNSRSRGIEVVNVLIWKTPNEFFASRAKRGEEKGWASAWINYYRMYFASVSDWISVRYSDLMNDESVLQTLCAAIQIPYFSKKHEYWRKTQHTLFGNSSAKIHLYDESSESYGRLQGELHQITATDPTRAANHRRVYYQGSSDNVLPVSSAEQTQFDRIQAALEGGDVKRRRVNANSTSLTDTEGLIHPSYAMLKRCTYRAWRRAAAARVYLTRQAAVDDR